MSATDDDRAARVRAAFAFADLSKDERAAALGVGQRHVTRYESGETPIPTDRLKGVEDATGVPRWFLEHGFAAQPVPEEPTVAERVEALERKLDALIHVQRPTPSVADLAAQITELRAGLLALAADNLLRTRAQLGAGEMGHQPGLQGGDG